MLRRVVRPAVRASNACRGLDLQRFFSTGTEEKELIYEAPLAKPVRTMKGVSITSCTLTTIGMPLTCIYGPETASLMAQWAMCGTVMFFGMGTTALFHVLFKPYVLRLWVDPSREKVTVETLNLLAAKTTSEFNVADTSIPQKGMHPMINLNANGRNYFVHPEAFDEEDRPFVERLLKRPFNELVPKEEAAPAADEPKQE